MMNNVKQVIVVRSDINMKRSELASQVAAASIKFLLENNEADRGNQMFVTLSDNETSWLTGSLSQEIVGVDSEEQLQNIMMRAEMMGIETHFASRGSTLTCVALGPDNANVLEKLVHRLKPL